MADRQVIRIRSYGVLAKSEYVAGGAITPGHLVDINSSNQVVVHASEGGNSKQLFADVDDMQGRVIDTPYASGERVHVWHVRSGDSVNAILADGETVAIGDLLMSAGDGTVKKYVADAIDSTAATDTVQPNKIVGWAEVALDLSDSSTADPSARLIMRII